MLCGKNECALASLEEGRPLGENYCAKIAGQTIRRRAFIFCFMGIFFDNQQFMHKTVLCGLEK
jgi:hypothetical protein